MSAFPRFSSTSSAVQIIFTYGTYSFRQGAMNELQGSYGE